jgi:DNA helicase-2/ATP-dependent DNA helicase PcrA
MWTDKKTGQNVSVLESYSKDDEAEKIADFIALCKRDHPEYFPMAILYRINSQSLAFETAFSRKSINFKIVKGLRFFQRKEIKDSIALLRLVMNPGDNNSFLRIVDALPLGIGPKAQQVLAKLASENNESMFEMLRVKMADKFSSNELFPFIFKLNGMRDELTLSGMMEDLIEKSGYFRMLERKNEESRKLNIQEFITFLKKWELNQKGQGFQSLMDYIQLNAGGREESQEESVLLLTMHNAKGLEFPTVIVAGINPSYMPFFMRTAPEEIEEERRLFYVALTRAVNKLIISTGSMRKSLFLGNISRSRYQLAERVEELFFDSTVGSNSKLEKVKKREVFVIHPIFGKGKIINSINETKHFIQFDNGKEVVIDVSIVDVEFIKEEA